MSLDNRYGLVGGIYKFELTVDRPDAFVDSAEVVRCLKPLNLCAGPEGESECDECDCFAE